MTPALIVIGADETKNDVQLELELPLVLSNRLLAMRNDIAPSVTGLRPQTVFVTVTGKAKSAAAIRIGIERTVLRRLGVHITPHQFRHFAAKLHLDANPGAYESARRRNSSARRCRPARGRPCLGCKTSSKALKINVISDSLFLKAHYQFFAVSYPRRIR